MIKLYQESTISIGQICCNYITFTFADEGKNNSTYSQGEDDENS